MAFEGRFGYLVVLPIVFKSKLNSSSSTSTDCHILSSSDAVSIVEEVAGSLPRYHTNNTCTGKRHKRDVNADVDEQDAWMENKQTHRPHTAPDRNRRSAIMMEKRRIQSRSRDQSRQGAQLQAGEHWQCKCSVRKT